MEITDNCFRGQKITKPQDRCNLSTISGKSLRMLMSEHEGLLVYPNDLGDNGDGLDSDDKLICTVSGNNLVTYNIMGYITVPSSDPENTSKTTPLRIGSRFGAKYAIDENGQRKFEELKKQDFFISYLLSKVGLFNVLDWSFSQGPNSVFGDLKTFLFSGALKRAISQGIYKEYVSVEYNDSKIRGTIDINRHIRQNIPFQGKFSYRLREYSYDNPLTQLIRHAIESVLKTSIGATLFDRDLDFKECINAIVNVTTTYNHEELHQVLNKNMRTKVHPLYSEYTVLQKLCIEILREEAISYGDTKDEVHGILFDGAWLWETYLSMILKGFKHPDNIKKKDAYKLFAKDEDEQEFATDGRNVYPDFYNESYVIDAKYKHLETRVGRNDLYQVISYMHTMPRHKGGFIYPYQIKDGTRLPIKSYRLNGSDDTIHVIPFNIPDYEIGKKDNIQEKWKVFCEGMEESEKLVRKALGIEI